MAKDCLGMHRLHLYDVNTETLWPEKRVGMVYQNNEILGGIQTFINSLDGSSFNFTRLPGTPDAIVCHDGLRPAFPGVRISNTTTFENGREVRTSLSYALVRYRLEPISEPTNLLDDDSSFSPQ
jgi:hypothetical protein